MLCCQPKTQRASLLAIHEASRAFIDKRLILTGIIAALIYCIGPAMLLSTCRTESGREYDWVTVTISWTAPLLISRTAASRLRVSGY